MRSLPSRLLIGVVLAIAAWFAGRWAAGSAAIREAPRVTTIEATAEADPQGGILAENVAPLDANGFRAALERLPREANDVERLDALFRLAQRLRLEEFAPAMEALRGMKNESDGSWRGKLLEVWIERDLAAAKQWLTNQSPGDRSQVFTEPSAAWAKVDAGGLRRWLAALPKEERERLHLSSELVQALTEVDPGAAFALSEMFPKHFPVVAILEKWATRNPAAAASRALELKDRATQDQALFGILKHWAKTAPEDALAWLENVKDPVLAARGRFAAGIAIADAKGIEAADIVLKRFPQAERSKMLSHIAWSISQKDPETVVRWAQENAEPHLRAGMIDKALSALSFQAVPPGAQPWPPLPEGKAIPDAKQLAELWLQECAPRGAFSLTANRIFAAVAEQAGAAEAARFLDRLPPEVAHASKGSLEWLASRRGWRFVAEAGLQLPPGDRRNSWLEQAVSGQAKSGHVEAAHAVAQRLPAPGREPVVRAIAVATFSDDPEASAQTLLQLPSGRIALHEGVAQWVKTDPRSARRWINTTELVDAGEREQLLGLLP